MEEIIEAIDKEVLEKELSPECFYAKSPHAGHEVYLVNSTNAPNVLREIGRIREICFRRGGGGTGKALDLDKFDLDPEFSFNQLVLWSPEEKKIIGGYRFVSCDHCLYDEEGQPVLPSSHLFTFTPAFTSGKFLQTIELSRSFISPEFQSSMGGGRQTIFALDNLFSALSSVIHLFEKKYFFGKVTVYPDYPKEALGMIMFVLGKHFSPDEPLVIPKNPVSYGDPVRYRDIFTGEDFKTDYRTLKKELSKMSVQIPPLLNSYINLTSSLLYFGGGINDEFGDVIELGILLDAHDVNRPRFSLHPEIHEEHFRKIKERVMRFWKAIKKR